MPGGTDGLMHIRKVIKVTGILVLLNFPVSKGLAQAEDSQPVRVMFYNVENLFDLRNDSLTEDDDFTPRGVMRWNLTRYNRKISSVYRTIVAAGEWIPPEIVAFCEIENRNVVEDLINGTYLSKYNYGIVHEESPDRRGIDVCLIYRKDIVGIIKHEYWKPVAGNDEEFSTRTILYTECSIGDDTIHLIVNHWPSRRGGVLAGEEMRTGIMEMVRSRVDSLCRINQGRAKIIVTGDFNCNPNDRVMQSLVNPGGSDSQAINCRLFNLAGKFDSDGSGTYRYMGTWEMIDQLIVSDWLLNCPSGLTTDPDRFRIVKHDFLLAEDAKFPGATPFSTYRGYRYQGGYSDHLPVMVDLIVR